MSEMRHEDPPTPYREEELRQALATDPRLSEPELEVKIAGDRAIVTGTVHTEERRAAITRILAERAPDLHLDDQTTLGRFPPGNQEERIG
jgi:BON domain